MSSMLLSACCCCPALRCACAGRLQDFITGMHDSIVRSFLPRQQDVTEDYWEWLKWRLGQVGVTRQDRSRTCQGLGQQQQSW
jgi:hypothetical protein